MGWFGNKSLSDEVFELEWEKQNTSWNQRLGRHSWSLVAAFLFFVFVFALIAVSQNQETKLTWGKVKKGDKLYPSENFIKDTSYHDFSFFCRMIRPVTTADIDTMQISIAEKMKITASLDTTLKNTIMLEQSEITIARDSMFKYGIASIGTFVSKDSTTATAEKAIGYEWYEVVPNKQLMDLKYILKIPLGYILANNNYYVRPYNVRLDEPAVFKKYKSAIKTATAIPQIITDSSLTKSSSTVKTAKAQHRKRHKIRAK
ncbi:MAG: hypothetical protein V4520_18030 [Bacteroidota bacterium]